MFVWRMYDDYGMWRLTDVMNQHLNIILYYH